MHCYTQAFVNLDLQLWHHDLSRHFVNPVVVNRALERAESSYVSLLTHAEWQHDEHKLHTRSACMLLYCRFQWLVVTSPSAASFSLFTQYFYAVRQPFGCHFAQGVPKQPKLNV